MKKRKMTSSQIVRWLCANYGLFLLGFFTLGFLSGVKSAVVANFVLDVALCAGSFVLNGMLFSPRHKMPVACKIGLLLVTLCFAAFTCFAFLMPENGFPPVLFS